MVDIDVRYDGNKKCSVHHEAGPDLRTDAPKDVGGDANAFSPTDLVAAGLATCIVTTMAMAAERRGIDFSGAKAHVVKVMNLSPRRIGRLPVVVTLPQSIPEEHRATLERAGHTCPVRVSLHPDIDSPIEFRYE